MSLYSIPGWFQDEFRFEFGDRLRLRWSQAREEWQLEQQVGRGMVISAHVNSRNDELIRARDGYQLVMSLRQGDRMPCPKCGLTLQVPIRTFGEASCQNCKAKGRDGRYRACFWPFSPSLMEHLRYIDPLRGGTERMVEDMDKAQALKELRTERATRLEGKATLTDAVMDCLPSWGYGGISRFEGA